MKSKYYYQRELTKAKKEIRALSGQVMMLKFSLGACKIKLREYREIIARQEISIESLVRS